MIDQVLHNAHCPEPKVICDDTDVFILLMHFCNQQNLKCGSCATWGIIGFLQCGCSTSEPCSTQRGGCHPGYLLCIFFCVCHAESHCQNAYNKDIESGADDENEEVFLWNRNWLDDGVNTRGLLKIDRLVVAVWCELQQKHSLAQLIHVHNYLYLICCAKWGITWWLIPS